HHTPILPYWVVVVKGGGGIFRGFFRPPHPRPPAGPPRPISPRRHTRGFRVSGAPHLRRRLLEQLRVLAQVRIVLVDHLGRAVPEQRRDVRVRHPLGERVGGEGVPATVG